MKTKWLAIFLLVAVSSLPTTGTSGPSFVNYRFNWLNTSEGLSQNTVNSILRDKNGYVWIGTNHGLNRYDGVNILTFSRAPNNGFSLGNDIVRDIIQIGDGSILVGTLDGITVFDKSGDTNFVIHPETFSGNIADKIVTSLFEGYNNQLLVGTAGGILIYDIAARKFLKKWQQKEFNIQQALYSFKAWNLIKVSGRILAFIGSSGYQYDHQSLRFVKISDVANSDVVFSGVQQMPGSNELLCYGKRVLCLYDLATNRFHNDMTGALTTESAPLVIESAVAISPVKIFAGVNKEGLYELALDRDSVKSTRIMMNNTVSFSGQNRFGCMMTDIQGYFWVGTDYGVFYCTPNQYNMKHYLRNELAGFDLTDNSLRSIQEVDDRRILLGGSKGLSLFDRKAGKITSLNLGWPTAGRKELSYSVNAIEKHDADLWIVGHMGLARIDEHLRKLTVIAAGRDSKVPNVTRAWGLCFIDDTAWVCTLNGELFSYAMAGNNMKIYKPYGAQTFFQLKSHGRNLVIAALGGVLFFNSATHVFSFVKLPGKANNIQVNALLRIDNNRWWAGTEGEGIFEFNPQGRLFDHKARALPGKVVYSLCADEKNNIWAGCNDGLYKISPEGQYLNHFTIQDGLQENEFTYGKSAQLLHDENILIGGINGFNLFASEKLLQQSSPFSVYLEQYKINSKTWFHPLNEIKKVEVNFDDKLIQFHFTFPDPGMRNSIHYFAQIEGDDTTWRDLGGSGDWIFSDFNPGNYMIRVRAGLAETGIPVSMENKFSLIVRPAYYQTFAFRLLLVVLALGILIFTFFYFYQQQSSANKLLSAKLSLAETEQHLAEANMAALRAQMNPHFIFNALGSIQNLIFKNEKDASISYLQRFAKMVRYILDKSRHEMVEVGEEITFLNSYLEMQQLRHQHIRMTIQNDLPPDRMHLSIPTMVVQPFLENSIEHAFPDKSTGMILKVQFQVEEDYLKIIITDNGVGIDSTSSKPKKDGHESFGVDAVKRRLSNLSKKTRRNAHVQVTDLSAKGECGTEIVLLIPTFINETGYD